MAFSLLVGVISALTALEYVLAASPGDYYAAEEEVIGRTMHNYYKMSIPRNSNGDPLKVNHSLQLTHFDLDVKRQILTMNVYNTHSWTDHRITWDPNALPAKVDNVLLPPEKIWIPDFVVYNSVLEPHSYVHPNALAYYNGFVHYIPFMNFKTSCKVDDHVEAGDYVTCHLDIGSWLYDNFKLDPVLTHNHIELDHNDFMNRDWEIVSTNATKIVKYFPCCPGTPYAYLRYSMDFKRTNHLD